MDSMYSVEDALSENQKKQYNKKKKKKKDFHDSILVLRFEKYVYIYIQGLNALLQM